MPKVLRSVVTGVGGFLPDRIVTNDDLSAIVETSDEWIRERTGIRQRRQASDDTPVSDLAVEAARRALAAASSLGAQDTRAGAAIYPRDARSAEDLLIAAGRALEAAFEVESSGAIVLASSASTSARSGR